MKRWFVWAVPLLLGAMLLSVPTMAQETELASVGLTMHGYYRVRSNDTFNLGWRSGDDSDWWDSIDQRMLLNTSLLIGDPIQINAEFDILHNVMFGDNEIDSTPVVLTSREPSAPENISRVQYGTLDFRTANVFSSSMSDTDASGEEVLPIQVRQLYANVDLSVGYLRFGRMANHFGLGMFFNSGTPFGRVGGRPSVNDINGGFYADSGDVSDRIMFGSRLWGIWYPSFAYDRIASDTFKSGKYDVHSFALINEVHNVTFGESGAFDGGLYIGTRVQDATDARLWIYDLYGGLAYGGFQLSAEAAFLQGTMTAVPHDTVEALEDAGVPTGQGGGRIDASAFLGVARFGYDAVHWGANIEYGLSSPADADPEHEFSQDAADNVARATAVAAADPEDPSTQIEFVNTVVQNQSAFGRRISTYPFNSSYNVDLICWRLLMGGAVRNGMYFRGGGFIRPVDEMYIDLHVINSYINQPYQARDGGDASHSLGWEGDLSFAYTFHKHFTAGFQTGYFLTGPYFDDVYAHARDIFTFQVRTIVDF